MKSKWNLEPLLMCANMKLTVIRTMLFAFSELDSKKCENMFVEKFSSFFSSYIEQWTSTRI